MRYQIRVEVRTPRGELIAANTTEVDHLYEIPAGAAEAGADAAQRTERYDNMDSDGWLAKIVVLFAKAHGVMPIESVIREVRLQTTIPHDEVLSRLRRLERMHGTSRYSSPVQLSPCYGEPVRDYRFMIEKVPGLSRGPRPDEFRVYEGGELLI